MTVIIALDEGTTNTKAIALDEAGRVLASASRPLSIRTERAGYVEQDADELWLASLAVVAECVEAVGADAVAGLAISNQRESVVSWNRATGEPIGPVLSWQDARTANRCTELIEAGHADVVSERTGLPLDAMFSAPKMAWLLDAAGPGAVGGTIDSWLVWRLTGGKSHVTEAGNASRTLLMDLEALAWDDELATLFGVSLDALPAIVRSDGDFGVTACDGLPRGLPILAVMADSHAALLGHGGGAPEVVKATYGTGSSVMQGTGATLTRREGIATTLAWHTAVPTYAVEGNIRYSGAALEWAARLVGANGGAGLGELAASVADAGGVSLVPAFGGLGAPHWDARATGIITGLSAATGPAHIARATFDAVAMQVADVVAAMTSRGARPLELRADGGATASALLMQTQADMLGVAVTVAGEADVALRGVAMLAFSRLGVHLGSAHPSGRFAPHIGAAERADARARWAAGVSRARA